MSKTVHYTEMLRRLPAVFSGAFILCGGERQGAGWTYLNSGGTFHDALSGGMRHWSSWAYPFHAADRQEQQKEYFVDSLLKAVQAAQRTARVKNMELTGISAHQSDEVMAMLNQCKVNS